MADQWYYRLFGTEFGPVTRSALDNLIESGQLGHSDEIRPHDSTNWSKVREEHSSVPRNQIPSGGTVMSLDSLPDAQIESATATNPACVDQWYYQTLGQDWGPISLTDLLELAGKGDVGPDDMVRNSPTAKWRRAGSIGRLMAVMPFQSHKPVATRPQPAAPTDDDELEFNLPQASQPPAADNSRRSATPTPAVQSPAAATGQASDPTWYAWVGGKEYGPVELTHLMEWAKQGRISPRDHIRHGQNSQWTVVSSVPGLIPAGSTAPPAAAPATATAAKSTPASVATVSAKSTTNPAVVTSAAAAPAAAKPVAASATAAPIPQPVTPEPAQDAALKATETGMSSMTSFSGSSTSMASTFNRGSQPAKKWTPPGKGGKKSGGKSSVDVSAILKDMRVWGAVGGLLLIVGLYFGWTMLPEGAGKFKEPYQQLSKIYKDVEDKAASSPSEAEWKEFGLKTEGQIKSIKEKLAGMKNSQHPVRIKLNAWAGQINTLLKKKPDDLETSLQKSKKAKEEIAKMLGVSS